MKPKTIIIYGESGDTKTTQTYFLAKWIHKTTGLKGRYIGFNASDISVYQESGMLDSGIIDHYDMSNPAFALAYLRFLSEGYWPQDLELDNKEIKVKGYFQKDIDCKTHWNTNGLTVNRGHNGSEIGFYIIEGIYGMSRALLGHIANQKEKVGFKGSYKIEEEGEYFGGTDEGHYGMVQQELYKIIVQGFATLPIKYLIVTSLVGKGENKRTNETIYGPKSAGSAQTFEIPSWFQDCYHVQRVNVQNEFGKVEEKRVAWFERHTDLETNVDYLAKLRTMPEVYQHIKKHIGGENGYIELGFDRGIDRVYEVMPKVVKAWQKKQEQGK